MIGHFEGFLALGASALLIVLYIAALVQTGLRLEKPIIQLPGLATASRQVDARFDALVRKGGDGVLYIVGNNPNYFSSFKGDAWRNTIKSWISKGVMVIYYFTDQDIRSDCNEIKDLNVLGVMVRFTDAKNIFSEFDNAAFVELKSRKNIFDMKRVHPSIYLSNDNNTKGMWLELDHVSDSAISVENVYMTDSYCDNSKVFKAFIKFFDSDRRSLV